MLGDAGYRPWGVGLLLPAAAALVLIAYADHLSLPGQLGCYTTTIQSGEYHVWNAGRVPDDQVVEITLDGPDGADYDLFLYRMVGSRFDAEESRERVASDTSGDSDERIDYTTSGVWQYLVEVRALTGSGPYTICIDTNNN